MILLTNNEGTVGAPTTARHLADGQDALDAIEAGIRLIEADPSVRTVGRGGWMCFRTTPGIGNLGQISIRLAIWPSWAAPCAAGFPMLSNLVQHCRRHPRSTTLSPGWSCWPTGSDRTPHSFRWRAVRKPTV